MSTRFIIYLRKSTESEDKQQLSLDGQAEALVELATKNKLTVVGEPIREAKSARKPGRSEFTRMMAKIADGEADGILCWHLNRLARNPVDGGNIMWQLSERVIREIRTPNATYVGSPDDRLMMSIIFGMATKRSDDIVRDVKRGIINTLEAGKWPNAPKMGYLRDYKTKEIVRDPDRWDRVREVWLLRLSGMPIMDIYRKARDEWGLTSTPRGKVGNRLVKPAQIYRILHDPFYAGVMVMNNTEYPGTHEPMVTMPQFEQVQAEFSPNGGSVPKPQQHDFKYRGLFRCGRCSALVTMQYTTNPQGRRYTYYFCCKKNKKYNFCPEKAVRETVIDEAIGEFLDSLKLPRSVEKVILAELKAFEQSRRRTESSRQASLQSELKATEARLTRLRALLVDGVITADEYALDRSSATRRVVELQHQLARRENEREGLIELFDGAVSLLSRAKNIFESAGLATKRRILRTVTSKPRPLRKLDFLAKRRKLRNRNVNLCGGLSDVESRPRSLEPDAG